MLFEAHQLLIAIVASVLVGYTIGLTAFSFKTK